MSQQPLIIQLYAGTRPDGEPVYEKVAVLAMADLPNAEQDNTAVANGYQLLHSPGFLRGIARGDQFVLISREAGTFKVTRRSGNLAVRVYTRMPSQALDTVLTPQVSQLNGRRDVMSERLLVYSIGLEGGFEAIEAIFDEAVSGSADASWNYGNVYDEYTGEALNWWLRKPEASA